jgi:uncharacterized membrane protein YvlD (DUF360 family)
MHHDVAMIRLLIRIGVSLLGNALGLLVAWLVLADFQINFGGFILAVVIFTVLTALLQPFFDKTTERQARIVQAGSSLVTTFLALLITVLVSDGIVIDGTTTWIAATVIVWLCTMFAAWLLPLIFIRNRLEDRR